MATDTKNVFISHVHEDDPGLAKLKDLLKDNGMVARDYSISSDNPNNARNDDYIKGQILGPRIRQSGVFIVYVSSETKDSDWVNWEIEYGHKNNKRIVGVWAHGEKDSDLPDGFEQYGDAMVGWQGNRIIDAINGKLDGFFEAGGEQIKPRDIPRHNC